MNLTILYFLFPIFKLLSRSKPSYLLPWYQIFYDLLALTPKFEVFYEIINQLPILFLKTLICLPGIAFFLGQASVSNC